jgi:hypothetical protein
MREIRFNAWLPDLEIMLPNITVYCDADQIGIDSDTLHELIRAKNEKWAILDDGVYFSDDDHFDRLLSLLCGDDLYYIDYSDCIVLEYSGENDINGQKLFEGDIICNEVERWEVVFNRGCFCGKVVGKTYPGEVTHIALRAIQGKIKKGNIYQKSTTK